MSVKDIAKGFTPPFLWMVTKRVKETLLPSPHPESFGEKDAKWYDDYYRQSEAYRSHYTASSYYFLWTVIADRILRANCRRVFDIGCGAGQFASLLRDRGLHEYRGLDLSSEAIERARYACPGYEFHAVSVFETDLIETATYDVAVSLEFLEHVEKDLLVVGRIPKGRRVIASVPNFPFVSHVRHFERSDDVVSRYGHLFVDLTVDEFRADEAGKKFFLLDGIRT